MDRRKFVFLLSGAAGACAASPVPIPKAPPESTVVDGCGICGGTVIFDPIRDINARLACGAHETTQGWQKP